MTVQQRMRDYYYCVGGQTVEGPHSGREIFELLTAGTLTAETLVCPVGEKEWVALGTVQLPTTEAPQDRQPTPVAPASDKETALDHTAIADAGTDKEDDEEEAEQNRGPSKYQLLKAIRADLDLLWKAQRESLISQIRDIDLDPEFETTRKEAKLIKERVREATQQYWFKAKIYNRWIDQLVWNDCDIQRRLRGDSCEEKHEDAKQWLLKAKLLTEAGCYCFRSGSEYLYIGKAGDGSSSLGKRLHDHRRATYFTEATHLRVIIPKHKTWIGKLERLLLLSHGPTRYNDGTPTMGNNPADVILDLLEKEMNDLLADG
jgi:hypothetical protein